MTRASSVASPVAAPVSSSGEMRTRVGPDGVPTQTPPAPDASAAALRMPSSVMSVISRPSVIPYGVCAVAPGINAEMAASSGSDTGAPAERNRSTPPRARWSAAVRSPVVATTLATAAGDRNTTVASTALTAAATAEAVSVFGEVTSMSGVTDRAPSAGPRSANGANPATSPVPTPTPYCAARASRTAESWACV